MQAARKQWSSHVAPGLRVPRQLAAPFLGRDRVAVEGRGFSRARLGFGALAVVWFTSRNLFSLHKAAAFT
jgi:hypothetical protein